MIYLGYYDQLAMIEPGFTPVAIDPRIPETDVPERFKPFYPDPNLTEWLLGMAEPDREVKTTFTDRYGKDIDQFPLQTLVNGLYEKYSGSCVVLLAYSSEEPITQIDILKKKFKSSKIESEVYDGNKEKFNLTSKETKEFRDFFVKLRKVYAKDVYVIGQRYILAGELSNLELSGTIVCEAELYMVEVFKKVFKDQNVYIPDISEIKLKYDAFIEASQQETMDALNDIHVMIDCKPEEVANYPLRFATDESTNNELIQKFFNDKIIVELHDPNKKVPSVLFGSSFLPLVEEKNIDQVFYSMSLFEKTKGGTIYQLRFEFLFSHFKYYAKYLYL
nr:MAG TPA: hypothetical protein [Caudoviricetes sp.]